MITSTADRAATPEAVPQPLGRGMGAAGPPGPMDSMHGNRKGP